MQIRKKTTAAVLTACVALGLGLATATPASAAGDKSTTGSQASAEGTFATLRVTTKDVKIKKGKFTGKDWMTIQVDVPDPYIASDGSVVQSTWWLSVDADYAANVTCAKGGKLPAGFSESFSGDQTLTLPALKSRGLEKKSKYMYMYHGAGRCNYNVTLHVNRAGDSNLGVATYMDVVRVNNVSYDNLAPAKSTISSVTKAKKNKSFTVSGKATFQNPKDRFKSVSVKKGTKVEIQVRKNGKGPWTTVKTTKVGSKGAWKTSIKLSSKSKVRAVVAKAKMSQSAVTKTRSISVKK